MRHGRLITAGRGLDAGDPRKCVRVSGIVKQRPAVLGVGLPCPAGIEIEIAEEDTSVGAVLRHRAAGLDRLLHCLHRSRNIAVQLPRIRHARVGAEVGAQINHLLKSGDRLRIATELNLGVADDAQRPR